MIRLHRLYNKIGFAYVVGFEKAIQFQGFTQNEVCHFELREFELNATDLSTIYYN